MKKIILLITLSFLSINVFSEPVTVLYNRPDTAQYGFIGINDGPKDSRWINWSADSEYLNARPNLGYGHGNRAHQLFYFDFSSISNQLKFNESIILLDISFTTTEVDNRHYLGDTEICPILVDWVSNSVEATWNNIEGSGTGVLGHGDAVQTGGRINSSNFSYPLPNNNPDNNFLMMIEHWINGSSPNYGFMVRETENTTSSVDHHGAWELSITYEVVPEPITLSLLVIGGIAIFECRKQRTN